MKDAYIQLERCNRSLTQRSQLHGSFSEPELVEILRQARLAAAADGACGKCVCATAAPLSDSSHCAVTIFLTGILPWFLCFWPVDNATLIGWPCLIGPLCCAAASAWPRHGAKPDSIFFNHPFQISSLTIVIHHLLQPFRQEFFIINYPGPRLKPFWRLWLQTALALQHVHSHGMVHMDVKPDNIYCCDCDADGGGGLPGGDNGRGDTVYKLGDFGTATQAKADEVCVDEGDRRCVSSRRLLKTFCSAELVDVQARPLEHRDGGGSRRSMRRRRRSQVGAMPCVSEDANEGRKDVLLLQQAPRPCIWGGREGLVLSSSTSLLSMRITRLPICMTSLRLKILLPDSCSFYSFRYLVPHDDFRHLEKADMMRFHSVVLKVLKY